MNGFNRRPVVAALDWITSFKGLFISLFVYGLVEFALYALFDSNRICDPIDRSEGWFDRCDYRDGTFRGTYLGLMQMCVVGVYMIAFAYRTYFTGKSILADDFDFKVAILRGYSNLRGMFFTLQLPIYYILGLVVVVVFGVDQDVKFGEDPFLQLVFSKVLGGYMYLLIDVILKDIWGQQKDIDLMIAVLFPILFMRVALKLEKITGVNSYLVNRGYI